MTSRSAHAGTISPSRHAAACPSVPTWLDRLGVPVAANDLAGPAVRVVVERGPLQAFRASRNLSARTTTIVAGARLDVVA